MTLFGMVFYISYAESVRIRFRGFANPAPAALPRRWNSRDADFLL